ncbi:serine/threonine-protein phosphatase 4 regulatory subunit 2-B isoform X1 [Carex littledalei]|uniref:Serine/threonine-protein phosphatase 4 regulatory subunit 2-B isoform X1 n=1 Tax=Carex littledalei TaxID=544730 RepID=A0A833QRV3_9POAL|nr:serine/threonine-protein phosphatase 4 regulatory subunit 2-B isoform X1 [Carex littledalei]
METEVELTNSEPTELISSNVNQPTDDMGPQNSNHEEAEPEPEPEPEPKLQVSPEEMRNIITVMAATGKFWHDWLFLRNLLSDQLKQVLDEYPETQQSSLSGETYIELVARLNEALQNFEEGPPFTLQRLCEILLSPKSTYSNLSKLALALEKNLLVTSTLSKCTEPYPKIPTSPEQQPEESTVPVAVPPPGDPAPPLATNPEPKPEPNGVEATSEDQPVAGDTDEEMPDADPEAEPEEEQNPNPPDVEMQDMDEKAAQEEEKVVQEEEEKGVHDESSAAPACQSDLDSVSGPVGEEAVAADKVNLPSVEPAVEL